VSILYSLIETHVQAAWVALVLSFVVLAKCAGIFVDSAVTLANRFRIPRLVIGIVLVSLATTAPELSVSLMAALQGQPEMALGNAIGSVICNKGLGLSLCAVISVSAVPVIPHVLRTSGGFLLLVCILAFLFTAFDCALGPWQGAILVLLFAGYLVFLFRQHKTGRFHDDLDLESTESTLRMPVPRVALLFALSVAGILLSSKFVIASATSIARSFHIPESAIALTLVALGTSIPEVATCVAAARKNEGAIAVGNILGANIMNICWVAGASSLANALVLSRREVFFMFPAMLVIVVAALAMLRKGYRLTRRQGFVLLALYAAYLASFFFLFPPAP
jgi:cation:H+ antiporter